MTPNNRECRNCTPPRSGFGNTTFHRADRIISLQFGPYYLNDNGQTGQALYYTTRNTGQRDTVRRIAYVGGGNRLPRARLAASATVVPAGEAIAFDASDSSDPDGNTLLFDWDFDDGTTDRNGRRTVTHRFNARGTYYVTVLVRDGQGGSDEETVEIRVGTPPTASIVGPARNTQFAVGDVFTLVGAGTDSAGNVLPDRALAWEVRQHHNTHFHPFLTSATGNNIVLSPAPQPEDFLASTNSYLEVRLTVTDQDGLSTTVTRDVLPKTVWLDFDTVPSGLELSIYQELLITPQRVLAWEHQELQVIALGNQANYVFEAWSDGGPRTHSLLVPAADAPGGVTSFVATFTVDDTAPVASPTATSLDCDDFDVDYGRMCVSLDPCCELIRADTSYCWDLYENVFTEALIRSACNQCCDKPNMGPAKPALVGLPKTISCAAVENPFRLCKDDSCCDNRASTSPFCLEFKALYNENEMDQICHYCCRDSEIIVQPLPTSPPSPQSTHLPTASPTTLLVCEDYDVDYGRMCFSLDPCCESVRADTSYCWNVYDNIFGTDALLRRACSQCCDKEIGDANPTLAALPKTISCSEVENPFRLCKTNSCCSNPRSASPFCLEAYGLYSDNEMEQICHYCCREPKEVGSRRRLGSSLTVE